MRLPDNFKSTLRHFVYYYTNGTLPYVIGDENILKGIDYREILKDEASLVEQAYAIFANNIQMDIDGKVLNQTHSKQKNHFTVKLFSVALAGRFSNRILDDLEAFANLPELH